MKLSIFGTGYVGLVTGACFSEVGHTVVCMDLDQSKIENLQKGVLPIWEPDLQAMVERNAADGRLLFTVDAGAATRTSDVLFLAVGTPPDEDGSADIKHILSVAKEIAGHMDGYRVIVVKSTVPVGTAMRIQQVIRKVLDDRGAGFEFDVVSNPEFLKEGAAVMDFLKPDRIVVGAVSARSQTTLRDLYEPFNRNHDRILFMDNRSAELTKYAANAMLATKISFMNEIASLAEKLGADVEQVRKGIGSDPRIGYQFIYPGCGYGGSCFPKDVKALIRMAADLGHEPEILAAVEAVNNKQKTVLFKKLAGHFGGEQQLKGKTIAVWGLAFKPNTDDVREAPSRVLINALLRAGAKVQAFDPVALKQAERSYGPNALLTLCPDMYKALDDADALAICTEWQHFRAPDFQQMATRMNKKVIVDGRNLYNPAKTLAGGWTYLCIGRPAMAEPAPPDDRAC